MAKEKKKGFVLRALDTVEHVGNALPNPAREYPKVCVNLQTDVR